MLQNDALTNKCFFRSPGQKIIKECESAEGVSDKKFNILVKFYPKIVRNCLKIRPWTRKS